MVNLWLMIVNNGLMMVNDIWSVMVGKLMIGLMNDVFLVKRLVFDTRKEI